MTGIFHDHKVLLGSQPTLCRAGQDGRVKSVSGGGCCDSTALHSPLLIAHGDQTDSALQEVNAV